MASSSPPHPPKLLTKAKKCKGYKTVESICFAIDQNASWCEKQSNMDDHLQVLLDATRAMAVVHRRYVNCDMADVARKFYNGSEDDWGEEAWSALNSAWMFMVTAHPKVVTEEIARELAGIDYGDFEGLGDLMEMQAFEELFG